MAESRSVWGIDIGQSALKAMKLRYVESAEQLVAVAFDYVPYPKILSQPDAIPEEIIPQALETFLSRNDVQGDLIAISVPGQSALTRFIQLPPVEKSKLPEIVKYEARQQIPFALEDVIWDYQPLGAGDDESGYLLDAEVGLFAMKRDQVMQHLRPFLNAKLEVELIQVAPLALYNMLSYDELGIRPGEPLETDGEHVIVLDMGCDNTTLVVSDGVKIWIRNVPLGGNHFTRALTKEMKLSFAKAEHLKCNATKSPDPRAVFQALRPVFNDYVSEIQRSIGYFSSVNRQAKISKVVGVGNGFKLAGLQKFLQQNLQYEVERPDTFRGVAGDSVLSAPLFSDNVLSFAVPYGLALQTLGLSRVSTTLLPPEIATARKIRRKKPWAVATAATLLAGLSLSTVGNGYTYSVVHQPEFAEAEKEAQDLAGEISGYKSAYDSQKSTFDSTRSRLMSLTEGRRDLFWLEVYNAVVDALPRDTADQQDEVDIEKRHMIALSQITSERMADVSTWFDGLSPQHKKVMTEEDLASPPSGEGYVFTLVGDHWHKGERPEDQGYLYLLNHYLVNLQKPQLHREGFPPRDVTRLGISHATVIQAETREVVYDQLTGPKIEEGRVDLSGTRRGGLGRRRLGAGSQMEMGEYGPGAGSGRSPMGRSPMGRNSEDVRKIDQTSFVIQFVLRPIRDKSERPEIVSDSGEEVGGEAAAEDAATTAGEE
ncbi:type IV pilus assembly protein PilM [Maioricimonas sp. JC845]|uniref:type IV pilus assembly protein PilM n=1 Tax=Maioricimonas sp. JC845 TaxID=3232138 RepID=UPI0034592D3C